MDQLHCDDASIFHNISMKMQNFSFVVYMDDFLVVSLCQNLIFVTFVYYFWMQGT